MYVCQKCGKKIDSIDKFVACPYCGDKVIKKETPPIARKVKAE